MPRYLQFDPTASHTTTTVTIDTQYTKLWLDGSDLTDKSGTNTLTVTGVTSSTAQSKFGGSSLFFDGTDDKIIFSNTGGSLQLSSDFTVEFWARWDGGSGYNSLLAFGDPTNSYIALLVAVHENNWKLWMANAANNGFNPSAQGFGGASANTWQHISVNCNSDASSVEAYVDGTRGYSGSGQNDSYGSSDSYSLSGRSVGQQYGGYVDDFFVLNGHKLRTGSSFTVPSTPFSGGLETSTDDARSYASVFDMRSQYTEKAAGNWPTTDKTIVFKVWGAGGGGTSSDGGGREGAGGGGGFAQGTTTATAGTQFLLTVGSGGPHTTGSNQQAIAAGTYGGGGNGYREEQVGGAGGGFSGVFTADGRSQANAIIIAGGGGGGASYTGSSGSGGGGGGGETGRNGLKGNPGSGGTQSAGGASGGGNATAGSALQGGNGGNKGAGNNRTGGGGGGGYYGGGGGGAQNNGGDGGGGSGYVGGHSSYSLSSTTNTQGSDGVDGASGNSATGGAVANSGDSNYPGSNAGKGGGKNASGNAGAIVIIVDGTATTYSSAGDFTFTVS